MLSSSKRTRAWLGMGWLLTATISPACQERTPPSPQVVAANASLNGHDSGTRDSRAGRDGGAREKEITSVLFDPRFVDAKLLYDAHDFRGQGKALQDVLARPAFLTEHESCVVAYAAGNAFVKADDVASALLMFDAAAQKQCPLAPYARVRAAQMAARSGDSDGAMTRAQGSQAADVPFLATERNLVVADCAWFKNEHANAAPLYRDWIKKNPHANRWVDVALKIAAFDLENADPERAKEALELSTRVLTEAPKLLADEALDARAHAAKVLGKSSALAPDERARRARGWLDADERARAIEEARSVALDPKATNEDRCHAEIVHANAEKGKKQIADAWIDAEKACEKLDDEEVTVLYSSAKAAASAKHTQDALDKFGRVEAKYPNHRLADDARLRAAFVYKSNGDTTKYEELATTIVDKYPNGDMADEGLFLVALAHIDKGDDAFAKPLLDKIIEREKRDGGENRSWATGGRAPYFRARISERAGDFSDAKRRYADVVTHVPLSYYAWLASSRLRALDPALATSVLQKAEELDAQDATGGAIDSTAENTDESDMAVLARRLLAVGEVDVAKRVFATESGEPPPFEQRVQIARMFDAAGKWDDGIAFSRGKTSELYAHYPTGKWRAAWEAAYPRAFERDVVEKSGQNAIPATLTWAIMREESSFMPEVKSPANAYGLMQLIVPTAKMVAAGTTILTDETSLKRADVSIALGTKLLASLRATTSHPLFAIAAYNGGAGAVKKWLNDFATKDLDVFVELIPWDETRGYVKRVTMSELVYAYLYDKQGFTELSAMPTTITR